MPAHEAHDLHEDPCRRQVDEGPLDERPLFHVSEECLAGSGDGRRLPTRAPFWPSSGGDDLAAALLDRRIQLSLGRHTEAFVRDGEHLYGLLDVLEPDLPERLGRQGRVVLDLVVDLSGYQHAARRG
jgi:hypothetical protein